MGLNRNESPNQEFDDHNAQAEDFQTEDFQTGGSPFSSQGRPPEENSWIYSQSNQNETASQEDSFHENSSRQNGQQSFTGRFTPPPHIPYGWQQPPQTPWDGVPPQDYTYMQGLGFVEELPEARERRRIRRTATAASLTTVLYSVLGSLLIVPLALVFRLFTSEIHYSPRYGVSASSQLMASLFNNVLYVICLLACILFLYFILRKPFRISQLFRAPKAMPSAVALPVFLGTTIVASGVVGLLQYALSRFGLVPLTPDFSAPEGDTAAFLIYAFCITILPAFLEELLFRGIVMTSLRPFGDTVALVMSSLLFALAHGNLSQSVNAFILAMVMGYFVLRTGSLWTGIILHFINNFIASMLPLMLSGLSDQAATVANLIISAAFLAVGILAVVLFSLKDKNAFRLINKPSALPVAAKMRTALLSAGFLLAAIYYGILIVVNFEVR